MTAPASTAAFDAFYRAQHGRLIGYFRKRVGCDPAPDLTQEVFTRLLRSGVFERIENPQSYLIRSAHNLVLERARRHMRTPITCPLDEEGDVAVPPDQQQQAEAKELCRALRRALFAMPRRTRRIFLMHRLRDATYKEIADELGISNKTVEQHITRALARCRKVAGRW